MADLPRLGVVVLNWNGRRPLLACLDSLARQTCPTMFVIVVDNGSTDGSVDLLRGREDVSLIALEENRRFAAGNNAGVQEAVRRGAEVVLILNNDTVLPPESVESLLAAMVERELDVAGPRIVFAERPDTIWYGGGEFSARTGWVAHRALRSRVDAGRDPAGPTDWVSGCALAMRADLWQRLGGLDGGYYIYSEDVDLCLRARQAGARVGYCPEATLAHEVSSTVGGPASPFKAYHRTRARRQLMRRHGRGSIWPAAVLAQDLAWAAILVFRGRPASARAVLQAVLDGPTREPRYRVEELGGVDP